MTENSIKHLLKLAGVSLSERKAIAWLSDALVGARHINRAAKERPLPADHNELLADIEKYAKQLTKQIERLQIHPAVRRAFWRSSVFGPVYHDRFEVPEVLSALEKIVSAARDARDDHKGRRRETGKQHVVDVAFAFFVRFSPYRPSGTPTGAFAKFAREFYFAVTGVYAESHGGLDRQIRQALERLPIERERAQRKSAEKSRETS
jgi:hypothetical protein